MSVSKEEVRHIADLAKLKLNDEEVTKYTKDLSNIVDYANELANIDISGIKPTNHILNVSNVFREDMVQKSYVRDKILKNAPTKAGGCISVPKVIE